MSAIILDEKRLRQYEADANQAGIPLGDALRKAIRRETKADGRETQRYLLPTFEMGIPGVNLVKALAVADELEDEAIIAKAGLRR
jgi:hypothetical protein